MDAPLGVHWKGRLWRTAQALFQATKFREPEIQERLSQSYTGAEAALLALRLRHLVQDGWDLHAIDCLRAVIGIKISSVRFAFNVLCPSCWGNGL